ncbi:hypothetical protein CGI80_00505 [Vibrio parahaemolyticus]|uniref:hypothetical protein n=1 Tax=Vibrionaceae TaxID=641 RepID=UPI00111F3AFD|nr:MULTISPECIES: hypothetical protein [Vibrionaceae]QSV13267.1 hypothetical protein FH974_10995 [Photobacterium ganghwense]TOH54201.1 hypothetical protein CGI80_00505 [Vibrio parahaemolyticus]
MNQLATQQQQHQLKAPSAQESITACRAHFNGQATRNKLREMFNRLPEKSRGLVLIAGGLPARDYQRKFESFDDLELQKIRKGMKYLKEMTVGFDNKLGDVRRLKHYQFSSTH